MRYLALVLAFIVTPAFAQQQQKVTAVGVLSQQLAAVVAQNAELIERVANLEEQLASARKENAELRSKEPAK